MDQEILVHQCRLAISGSEYEVQVYARGDGTHVAKTVFAPGDVIVNDGESVKEALERHARLLPLAIDSRQLLKEYRRRFDTN